MEESKNVDGVTDLLHAQAHVWNHALSFMKSMSLKCALDLGIPDTIHKHGKPMTVSELAAALSIPPSKVDRLRSLMRLLSYSGFFVIQNEEPTDHIIEEEQREKEKGYGLTPSSRLLVGEEKACIKPFVVMSLDSIMVDPFQHMAPWFKETGTTLFKMAHGKQFWEATNASPDFNELFNNGMASDTRFVAEVMSRGLSHLLCGVGSLVDVGGGTGTLAFAIAEKYRGIKCTVFDLPHVIDTVPKNTSVDFIGGDMFQEIPRADVVLLKWILHDWSDEESIKILQRCMEAIPSHGKVIIIDMVVGNTIDTHTLIETQLLLDLKMTGLTMGKERDESEWRSIFLAAGFGKYKISPSLGVRSIIEIYP